LTAASVQTAIHRPERWEVQW